jgi:23S rRNA (uridine2552-2'-O)-methyltransferase
MTSYKKPDPWALRARREGYPARSVYKLQEIAEKFGLLRLPPRDWRVLDLGAAPGSWSLFVLRKLKGRGQLTSADLAPLSPQYGRDLFGGDNFRFVQGDITARETREALLARGPFNLIVSDAAPETTGNRSVDTLRSLGLAEAVLGYAETVLTGGGNLVVKVFQSGETQGLLRRLKGLFTAGKSFKPSACRPESFETYYIGLGKNT